MCSSSILYGCWQYICVVQHEVLPRVFWNIKSVENMKSSPKLNHFYDHWKTVPWFCKYLNCLYSYYPFPTIVRRWKMDDYRYIYIYTHGFDFLYMYMRFFNISIQILCCCCWQFWEIKVSLLLVHVCYISNLKVIFIVC